MVGQLSEPYKSEFNKLQTQYEKVLKDLPLSDAVPAALEANANLAVVFSALQSNQHLLSFLSGDLSDMQAKLTAARAEVTTLEGQLCSAKTAEQAAVTALASATSAMPATAAEALKLKTDLAAATAAVTAATATATAATAECSALKAKIDAGDFIAKEKVTELCSAAHTIGLTEGEAKIKGEVAAQAVVQAKIAERKTGLCSEKLPTPEVEALLAGTDEEFTARKTAAVERTPVLLKKGFSLNSKTVAQLAWASAEEYTRELGKIDQLFSERAAPAAGNMFLAPPAGTAEPGAIPGGAY